MMVMQPEAHAPVIDIFERNGPLICRTRGGPNLVNKTLDSKTEKKDRGLNNLRTLHFALKRPADQLPRMEPNCNFYSQILYNDDRPGTRTATKIRHSSRPINFHSCAPYPDSCI
ncbi:hypothetical protein K443DRAFT_207133 [Laccaria amethystina LaAM-08-1]|uniref:Uncharacterized protein n=1 Tax=Laccaria amethystina LaAM-08-1 TaxID=1095629 RepID=A0A0C9XAR8_9AGAR|nr:hypothetical protein K443DRAFT_207133 [Laccaria amethystina LaAM-08-1]